MVIVCCSIEIRVLFVVVSLRDTVKLFPFKNEILSPKRTSCFLLAHLGVHHDGNGLRSPWETKSSKSAVPRLLLAGTTCSWGVVVIAVFRGRVPRLVSGAVSRSCSHALAWVMIFPRPNPVAFVNQCIVQDSKFGILKLGHKPALGFLALPSSWENEDSATGSMKNDLG